MMNYLHTPAETYYYGHAFFDLIAKGTIKVNIHKEYPFTAQGVQDAQRDLTNGKTTGKLVIKV
jgi:NADPH:quinone reductase